MLPQQERPAAVLVAVDVRDEVYAWPPTVLRRRACPIRPPRRRTMFLDKRESNG
jgi:hypothetical protein